MFELTSTWFEDYDGCNAHRKMYVYLILLVAFLNFRKYVGFKTGSNNYDVRCIRDDGKTAKDVMACDMKVSFRPFGIGDIFTYFLVVHFSRRPVCSSCETTSKDL
jgi:hypothetical protein